MKLKTIILILLSTLFIIILVQNMQVVEIRLFFWSILMPRIIFIPGIFALGFCFGFLWARLLPSKKQSPPDHAETIES